MNILIKNEILPHRCQTCFCCEPFFYGTEILCNICRLLGEDVTEYQRSRNPDCPLIEIPTPHGRLIDADKIEYHFEVNENTAMEGFEFVTKGEIGREYLLL